MPNFLIIHLGHQGELELGFRLLDSPVTELWLERMANRHSWPLDHPDRFYNFLTADQEQARARLLINRCANTINQHSVIIDREFDGSQDSLNYLHSVFEKYHGLLDCQDSEYWRQAPPAVQSALAQLNLAVHRYESLGGGSRFVCTWFGMPKQKTLNQALQLKYGVPKIQFGHVYLNYCEIGKTVEDLAHDNDRWISEDAFRPWNHYSADFNVCFYDKDLTEKYDSIQRYIDSHCEFFLARGIDSVYNVQAQPLRFPVAVLDSVLSRQSIIDQVSKHQWVYSVEIQ